MRNTLFIAPLVATTCLFLAHLKSWEYRPHLGNSFFNTDTVKKKITNQIENVRKKNGNHFLSASEGIKLYANIQKGKVQKFSAVDSEGRNIGVTTSTAKIVCQACVIDNGRVVCWEISCKDLPRPPTDKVKIVN